MRLLSIYASLRSIQSTKVPRNKTVRYYTRVNNAALNFVSATEGIVYAICVGQPYFSPENVTARYHYRHGIDYNSRLFSDTLLIVWLNGAWFQTCIKLCDGKRTLELKLSFSIILIYMILWYNLTNSWAFIANSILIMIIIPLSPFPYSLKHDPSVAVVQTLLRIKKRVGDPGWN